MEELEAWRAAMGLPEIPADPADVVTAIRQGQIEMTTELAIYLALRGAMAP